MSASWYVMSSKPNKEDFLADQLQAHGVTVFHPRVRVQVVNPRARKVRPYFPGYLFIKIDLTTINLSTLSWMPGAASLVTYDREPASVPENLIADIRYRVDVINRAGGERIYKLHKGDLVVIQAGPFSGYEAIFDERLSGDDRVRVLLKLLQKRQISLELPLELVCPQNNAGW
jgi:transcription antitermination factor NusG